MLNNILIDFLQDGYGPYFKNPEKTFPGGKYTVAIQAYTTDSLRSIGHSRLSFFNASKEKQIKLLNPDNNSQLKGNGIGFHWKPKQSMEDKNELNYSIRIKPVFPWQSPEDAMKSNPLWFQQKHLTTTKYFLSENQKALKSGSTYAWQVIATNKNVQTGKSPIVLFHVGEQAKNDLDQKLPSRQLEQDSLTKPDLGNLPSDSLNSIQNPGFLQSLLPQNEIPDPDLKFSGNTRTEGFYSTRPEKDSFHQNNYLQTRIQSKIQAFGLPLKGNAFLTTQQMNLKNSNGNPFANNQLNRFNLGLDLNAIKQNARKRLQNEIQQYKALKKNQNILSRPDTNALANLDKLKSNKEAIKEKYGEAYFDRMKKKSQLQVLNQLDSAEETPDSSKIKKRAKPSGKMQNYKAKKDSVPLEDSLNKAKKGREKLEKKRSRDELLLLKQYLSADNKRVKKNLKDSLETNNPGLLKKFESLERADQINNILEANETIDDQTLKSLGGKNPGESFLLNLEDFNVGNFYANHSPITLQGINIRGVNLSYETSDYHVSLAWGNQQNSRLRGNYNQNTGRQNQSRKKNIMAGKAGLGSENGTHLFVTFLKGKETQNNSNTPLLNNYIFGTEGQLNLADQFNIKGEVARSITNYSNTSPNLSGMEESNAALPNSHQTKKAIAYNVEADYQNPGTNTRLNASLNKTGPGYYSTGVPFLRTDQFRYQGRITQSFLRRQITFTPYIQKEQDNLMQLKGATSMVTSYGGMLNVAFRQYPSLSLNYAPYQQRVVYESNSQKNYKAGGNNLTVNGNYDYQLGNLNLNSNLSYTYQEIYNTRNKDDRRFKTYRYKQTYRFQAPFTLSHGLSYYDQHKDESMKMLDGSAKYRFSSDFMLEGGVSYWEENGNQNHGMGYSGAVNCRILDNLRAEIRVDKQNMPGTYYGIRDEVINPLNVRGTVSYNW